MIDYNPYCGTATANDNFPCLRNSFRLMKNKSKSPASSIDNETKQSLKLQEGRGVGQQSYRAMIYNQISDFSQDRIIALVCRDEP